MESYSPNQYPTNWAVDPQTQMVLANRPEKFYGSLFHFKENEHLQIEPLIEEFRRRNCFLMTFSFGKESALSEVCQGVIASHFGLLDTSLPTWVFSWILGAYAGLNRPVFLLNRKNFLPDFRPGSFRPALGILYESTEEVLKQLQPLLPSFFKSLSGLNTFNSSLERFLEHALEKLDSEQLKILKFILLLDRNPFTEEEIIAPLKNYSERFLDIFLSEWSDYLVSLGLLRKEMLKVLYGDVVPHFYFSPIHLPLLRKVLFSSRYLDPHSFLL